MATPRRSSRVFVRDLAGALLLVSLVDLMSRHALAAAALRLRQLAIDPIYAHVGPRARRMAAVGAIGPLIVLAGLLWVLVQPDRLPLLDPDADGFWSLAVEPPLLVLLAGLFFHKFIAAGLIRDVSGSEVG